MSQKMMKRKLLFLLLPVFFSAKCFAQEDIIVNFNIADSIFNAVLKKYDFFHETTYTAIYKGNEYISGHFSVPNQLNTYPVHCEIKCNVEQTFISTELTDSTGEKYVSQYLFSKDSCRYKDYDDSVFYSKAFYNGFMEYFFNPMNILFEIAKYKNTLHFLTTNDKFHIIGYNDSTGNKYFVYIDKKNLTIFQIVKFYSDWSYGDTFDRVIYEYNLDTAIPADIAYYKGKNIKRHISLVSVSDTIRNGYISVQNAETFEMDTLSNNCFLIKITSQNNKVLVYKYNKNLYVFEAPLNPIVSNQLIDYLNKQFNNTPVAYCFLSHHHPDHAGGVKSFKEIGVKIITSAGDMDYISQLANYPFKIKGIYDKYSVVNFDTIQKNGTKKFIAGNVIAYEIGKDTRHTENFLVYYLPEENILFSSDLVFLNKSKILNQGQRAFSVYNLIKREHIPTEKLKVVPSYPLKNYKDYGTFYNLIDCLRKNYPDLNEY
jgi:hypothetical protein